MSGGRFKTVVVVGGVDDAVAFVVVDFFLDLGFDFCLRFGASSAATPSFFAVDASSLFVDFADFFVPFDDDFFFPPPPVAFVVVARCSCARFLQMYSKSAVDFLVVVDSDLGAAAVVVALRPPSSRSRSSASTNDRYDSSSSIVPALSTVSTPPNVAAYVSGVHALGARSTLAVVVSAASSSVAFPSASLARTRNLVPWYASIKR